MSDRSGQYNHSLGKPLLDKLEVEATRTDTGEVSDVLLASIAISVKRIADLIAIEVGEEPTTPEN